MRGEKCREEEGAGSSPVTEAPTSKELLEQEMASVALPNSDAAVAVKISPILISVLLALIVWPSDPADNRESVKKDFERIPTKEFKMYPVVTRCHIIIFHVSHRRRLESSPRLEIQYCQPPPSLPSSRLNSCSMRGEK